MAADLNIRNFIPSKHKVSPKGWITFNAPCCHHRGNSRDTRGRGGMLIDGNGDWTYHCFNCNYAVKYVNGEILSYSARRFLKWLGVDENVIQLMVLESLRTRSIDSIIRAREEVVTTAKEFEERELPEGADLLTAQSLPIYTDYILHDRGLALDAYPFMITPEEKGRAKDSVILPFTHNGKIVGHTRRFLDGKRPKYLSDQQSDYVFGFDLQVPNWEYVIVVEGPFDAISINGVAVLHSEISDAQAEQIESLNKEIIVLPDRNKAGFGIIDRAIELGWGVSLPEWDNDITDANDAVKRYGKFYTLATILAAKETNRIKIELRKRSIVRQLQH